MTTNPELAHLLEQASGGGGAVEIQDNGVTVVGTASIIDFTDSIDVNNPSAGEAAIFVADAGIDTAELANDSVTQSKVATDAIGSNEIATDAVGSDEIATDAVDSDEIATDAVRSDEIIADAIGTSELDLSISPTWTGTHTFNGNVIMGTDVDMQSLFDIINLPTPNDPGDAARKGYVDGVAQGLDLKDSVRATTDGTNIDLGSATDPNPIDGVTLNDGDRVLLKDQTDATENGIYDAVTATDPTTWTRSDDFNEDDEVTSGSFTFSEEGTNNGNTSWIVTTDDPITVGVTNINWSQFSAAGEILAGNGLTKSGQTISIATDGVGIDELDLSISPTWTSLHTFDAGITLNGALTDQAGNSITDFAGTNLSVSSGTLNASGGATPPISVPDDTLALDFADDSGAEVIADMDVTSTPAAGTEESLSVSIDGTNIAKFYAEADGSGSIENQAFRTFNMIRVEGTGSFDEGLNFFYNPSTGGAQIGNFDGSSIRSRFFLQPGFIDFRANNLRMDAGQAIKDGSGTDRFLIDANRTAINDDNGNLAISLLSGQQRQYRAGASEPILWFDTEGSMIALRYITSASSPGTLELTNAIGTFPSQGIYAGISPAAIGIGGASTSQSGKIIFQTTEGETAQLNNGNGELIGRDNAGNSTTLT